MADKMRPKAAVRAVTDRPMPWCGWASPSATWRPYGHAPQTWGSPNSPGTETPSSNCSHQIPWPPSMIRWPARSSSLASASHANQFSGTDSSRPSMNLTDRRARSTETDAASGYRSGRLAEELMRLAQELLAIGGDDSPNTVQFAGIVPPMVTHADWAKPEDRPPVPGLDVDVLGFVRRLVLVGEEPEPVRTKAVNRGHADLADWSTGSHHDVVRFTAAYLFISRLLM